MEIATGFADSDYKDAIAQLVVATGDLSEAQMLAALSADVAAGRNISLADASNMLVKAVGGNTMMLKRNMPWLDANKDGTITLAEAVQGLTDKYGGAAAAAADNNPWLRIQAVWNQMKEALGQFILPALQSLGDWFSDKQNQKALQGWIEKVGEFSYEIGEKLVTAIQTTLIPFINDTLMPTLQGIADWFASPDGKAEIQVWVGYFMTFADAIAAVASAMETLAGWWNMLPEPLRKLSVGSAVGSAFGLGGGVDGDPTVTRDQVRTGALEYGAKERAARNWQNEPRGGTTNITVNQASVTNGNRYMVISIRFN
jgi:hypothetical protein